MQRRLAAAILGGVLVLGLGGLVVVRAMTGHNSPPQAAAHSTPTTCADAYRVFKLPPSEVTAATPVCLNQGLQLTGEVVGSVAQAYAVNADSLAPSAMCTKPKRWSSFPQALLAFVVAGKGYRLRIAPSGVSEHQPVSVANAAGLVELASVSDPSVDWNQANGNFTVNEDGVTGTIAVDLLQNVSGARPVHVAGTWACGAPVPSPSFDASVPCANFYALNQLTAATQAHLASSSCTAGDLTFSGDVVGHVDHTLTDRSSPQDTGIAHDGLCGDLSNSQYDATLKFSVGDESFLLDLHASNLEGNVGAGTYGPHSAGWAFGIALILGTADPSSGGAFVEDDQVYWFGSGGSFTIARDLKSGTISADLASVSGASTVHIQGSWRCAA